MTRIYKLALQESNSIHNELVMKIIEDIKNADDMNSIKKEELESYLESRMDALDNKLKKMTASNGEGWNFDKVKKETVFAESDTILLTPISDKYKDKYFQIRKAYSALKPERYDNEKTVSAIWEAVIAAFYVAIIRKSDQEFLGYVAIENPDREPFEISIELLEEFCCQGYGYSSLQMFLDRVSDITGRKVFKVNVEVDNFASQALMKKVGFKFSGLVDHLFVLESEREAFEDKYIHLITDNMRELAKELNVEPRKLLSHVLEYRLEMK